MRNRLFVYFFAAWAGLLGITPAVAAELVFPPGLRIGLEPAGELKLAHQFPGFEDPARNVTVTIFDLPSSAFHELETAAFNNNQLANVKRESFPFANGIGFLISGSSQQNGVTIYRWSLLSQAVGGTVQNLTALINVQVAESARSTYSDEVVRKMLASVNFRTAPIQEQLSLLPFKLGDLAGFRVMQVLPTGSVILAEDGSDRSAAQPFMIVSIERGGPAEAGDRATFSRDLLANAPVRDLTLQSAESMRINGMPGYEIRAQGKDPTGAPVSVVQWLRFGTGSFLRVIGVSPTEKWNGTFERFRALRDGIAAR